MLIMSTQRIMTTVHRPRPSNDDEPATMGDLRREFAVHDDQLRKQFESQYEFHKDVFVQLKSEIAEKHTEIQAEMMHTQLKAEVAEIRGLLSGVLSVQRNRLAIRAVDTIFGIPTQQGTIPASLPRNVGRFWLLGAQQTALVLLLKAYDYSDFEVWDDYDDDGNPIDIDIPVTQLRTLPAHISPLEYYVGQYPEKAHRALAGLLGLDFNMIQIEMEKHQRYTAKGAEPGGNRRRKAISDESSLTEEIHRGPRGNYKQTKLSTPSNPSSQEMAESWPSG